MPVQLTYPGVYVEKLPGGAHVIAGVATSIAAFVGSFPRGLVDRAVPLFSQSDFDREFGGLSAASETSYAIQQFFVNGGAQCLVVRVAGADAAPAACVLGNGLGDEIVRVRAGRAIRGQTAVDPGDWGNALRVEVDYATRAPANAAETGTLFTLTVSLIRQDGDRTMTIASERYVDLTMAAGRGNAIDTVNARSLIVQLDRDGLSALPAVNARPAATGTTSGLLPPGTTAPGAVTSLTAVLTIDGVAHPLASFAIPQTAVPGRLVDWAATVQAALRAQVSAQPAALPLARQPYLAEATVAVVGDNTAVSPARLVVRLGRSARPFDPDATIGFGGDSLAVCLLDPAGTGDAQAIVSGQQRRLTGGGDGTMPVPVARYRGPRGTRSGIFALEDADLFNILCLPDAAAMAATELRALYADAEAYCAARRAMVLVDIPATTVRPAQMQAWLADNDALRHPNAAVYYPRPQIADPLAGGRSRSTAASGTIAGLFARTDAGHGVWKAPAGTDARLRNVATLDYLLTDPENGALNPLGVNCLRTFPAYGSICWGARTLAGADRLASTWKYVSVRRLALFLEESLCRGLKWVVFEPNDEALWSQIRLTVGTFMQGLFRQGAFQGATSRDAWFMRCDGTTTTQADIANGIVNVEVGFAPLKPAEFVVFTIQQIARRSDS